LTFCQKAVTFVKKKIMARIYVKGYTKPDGTKVKGHYRDVPGKMFDRKRQQQVVAKIRMGDDPKKALQKVTDAARRGGKQSVRGLKKQYGAMLAQGGLGRALTRTIGAKI
jgi:hypothetical protein